MNIYSDDVKQTPRKHEISELSIGAAADLQQRRLQFVEDMANHSVKADCVTEFSDAFLPLDENIPQRPQIPNPFGDLAQADSMLEIEVQDLFVSFSLLTTSG